MKLLIVTQTVDENDPVLGFFCRWLKEFAQHFETITVIAFSVSQHNLPRNVSVHSLGKENGVGKMQRLFRYVSLLISLRKNYTHVFAHMSPEYVIAGAPVWFVFRKKVALWYNHTQKSQRLSIAASVADIVFHTSPFAASASCARALRMPAGIDTELFKPQGVLKNPLEVYFQGRVAAAKRVGVICEAVKHVRGRGTLATLTIVGPQDFVYAEHLKNHYGTMISERALLFLGSRPPAQTPALYSAAHTSINLTASGNYDKTVLESMACETPVIVSSQAFADMIPARWIVPENDAEALAKKIEEMLALPEEEYHALKGALRKEVVEKHSVSKLAHALATAFSSL